MSGKRNKQIRRFAKWRYDFVFAKWCKRKPPHWHIFKYLKWKKSMPTYADEEKKIKYITKRR